MERGSGRPASPVSKRGGETGYLLLKKTHTSIKVRDEERKKEGAYRKNTWAEELEGSEERKNSPFPNKDNLNNNGVGKGKKKE